MKKVKISLTAVGTWLEPYIGFEFTVNNESRNYCVVDFYGESKKIENQYLTSE